MAISLTQRLAYTLSVVFVFNIIGIATRDDKCYQPFFLETQWTDSCPKYCVNMTFHKDGTVSSYAVVNEVVEDPIIKLVVSQADPNGKRHTLYNITVKTCAIMNTVYKIPLFKPFMMDLKKQNYSFQCPILKGVHNIKNVGFEERSPFFALMYRQKTPYTVSSGQYKELPNKSLATLNSYKITAKIIKRPCVRKRQ